MTTSRTVGTLSVAINTRLEGLQQGLQRANRLVEGSAGQIERRFQSAGAVATRALGALGLGVSVAGLTAMVTQANGAVLAIKDLAETTGSTVDRISALEDVARRTGGSIATVDNVLVALNRTLKDAEGDNPQARALRRIGLDAAELQRLDPADALKRVADQLVRFADNGQRARVVQDIFKGSTREAAGFLRDLADAGELNGTVTARQVEEADRFAKSLARLKADAQDAARAIGGPLVRALNNAAEQFAAGREAFGGNLLAATVDLGLNVNPFETIQQNLESTRKQIAAAEQQLQSFQRTSLRNPLGFTGVAESGVTVDLERLRARERFLTRLRNDELAGASAADPRNYGNEGRNFLLSPSADGTPPRAVRLAEAARAPLTSAQQTLVDALRRIEQTDEAKLGRLRAELDALVNLQATTGGVPAAVLSDLVQEITALDPAARAAADAQKRLQDILDEGQRIYQDTRTPAELLGNELNRLNELLDAGAISWDTYFRAQNAAQDRFDEATREIGETTAAADDMARSLGLTFSSAFEDAIVGGKGLSDVLRGLEQDLLRLVTRRLITEPLGNLLSNAITGAFAGGFATGGYIPPGKWGMTGERGPEPVFGGRTGATVLPNSSMGRSITVHNTFVLSAPADRSTQQQVAALAARAIERAALRNN
jgi:hypothetical protein